MAKKQSFKIEYYNENNELLSYTYADYMDEALSLANGGLEHERQTRDEEGIYADIYKGKKLVRTIS